MPRSGIPGKPRVTKGRVSGTCGKCPCCRLRAAYNTAKNHKLRNQRLKSEALSDEDLDRKAAASLEQLRKGIY